MDGWEIALGVGFVVGLLIIVPASLLALFAATSQRGTGIRANAYAQSHAALGVALGITSTNSGGHLPPLRGTVDGVKIEVAWGHWCGMRSLTPATMIRVRYADSDDEFFPIEATKLDWVGMNRMRVVAGPQWQAGDAFDARLLPFRKRRWLSTNHAGVLQLIGLEHYDPAMLEEPVRLAIAVARDMRRAD